MEDLENDGNGFVVLHLIGDDYMVPMATRKVVGLFVTKQQALDYGASRYETEGEYEVFPLQPPMEVTQ